MITIEFSIVSKNRRAYRRFRILISSQPRLATYVSIGAYAFSVLEREYEKEMCHDAENEFKDFTDR